MPKNKRERPNQQGRLVKVRTSAPHIQPRKTIVILECGERTVITGSASDMAHCKACAQKDECLIE